MCDPYDSHDIRVPNKIFVGNKGCSDPEVVDYSLPPEIPFSCIFVIGRLANSWNFSASLQPFFATTGDADNDRGR